MDALPLYQQVMGEDFARLAPAVQAFHSLQGRHELRGAVETAPPQSRLARWIARGLGSPLTATRGAIRFELDAQPQAEAWTRHFPSKTMTSHLHRKGARLVERLGLADLEFSLLAEGPMLVMRLERLRFCGLPCPRWLMPQVLAQESQETGRFHFEVRASVPFAGLVTHYRGTLGLPLS